LEIFPSLLSIQPFDALKGTSIYFTYTGSRQALDNNLVITNVETGEIVYNFEYSSFEKTHPIPPNTLNNGSVYKAKIRVKFNDGTYSPYSNEVQFRTFQTPVLDIDNIDGLGHVYNQDVTFIATYSQADGENVKTYRFSLYDENEDLIQHYPVRAPQQLNEIVELIEGLEKGKAYFVECLIETTNGVVWTHRERFIPMYIVPSVNGLISTESDKDEGFVRINANLKQVLGTQVKGTAQNIGLEDYDSDNYEYIDDEWVVIPKNRPLIFKGLGMNRASDFVMKLWCKNVPSGTMFAELSPVDDTGIPIKLYKYDNRIVAVKEYNGVTARYTSNVVLIPQDAEFMVYVKAIEHRLDISLKILV
jgi:hypothetical protein